MQKIREIKSLEVVRERERERERELYFNEEKYGFIQQSSTQYNLGENRRTNIIKETG